MFGLEAPPPTTVAGFDGIDVTVGAADEDPPFGVAWRGDRGLPHAKAPQLPAAFGLERVQRPVHRPEVDDALDQDRRGGHGALGAEAPLHFALDVDAVEVAALAAIVDALVDDVGRG